MRTIRTVAGVLACIALVPALGSAQGRRPFEDSWFWGAKGGVAMFTSASEEVTAPMVGGEWLITRQKAALYVSIEQAFFDTEALVFDASSAGAARDVLISDLRRYHVGLFAFPKRYGALRPYGGIGIAINVIQDANPQGTFTSPENMDTVMTRVDDQTSRTSLVFTGGLQASFDFVSLFVQASTMPTRHRFLINGAPNTMMLEAGIRYNLVGAIEKIR